LGFTATTTTGLGSGFGGLTRFGALASSGPVATFGRPGSEIKSEKPAKPFGAPESDAEANDDEDENDSGAGTDDSHEKIDPQTMENDKKKPRLQKGMIRRKDAAILSAKSNAVIIIVDVDDGEAGESTILAVRAKLFYLDKERGWKERGAGMLKISVPESSVKFDHYGVPVPGSFDASYLRANNSKRPRLILRQDQTHRVLLNTTILPMASFQEKTTFRATNILFTSFEGSDARPVSITAKVCRRKGTARGSDYANV
jgi:DEAD/DEAH box helicase domain-containing protein